MDIDRRRQVYDTSSDQMRLDGILTKYSSGVRHTSKNNDSVINNQHFNLHLMHTTLKNVVIKTF